MRKTVTAVISILFCLLQFIGCQDSTKQRIVKEGRQLAAQHCQSCHQLPSPYLLNKTTWANFVLPKMGNLLGFRRFESGGYYETGIAHEVLTLDQWNKIVAYYLNEAPDSLQNETLTVTDSLEGFEIIHSSFSLKNPATTYVGILGEQKKIFFGDGLSQQLYQLSPDLSLEDSFHVGEGLANVAITRSELKALTMGVLHPSDEMSGKLTVINTVSKKSFLQFDSLQRPVYAEYKDLNEDSLQDIVVCEFGNNYGQLSWYENKGSNQFSKHILRSLPGAVKTQVIDLNKDGRLDIVALMAQGDEGFFVYYNEGRNLFREKRLMQFSPAFGSNYFELLDFNNDGFEDILATNGDNGDYPPILKPYHGIRIYINDGKNIFKEGLFLPMNGASKAIAKDFDNDGDLDIVSISFFPDYNRVPNESFIFWENKNGSFAASTFKQASMGRWLTMDAGDIDGDGDADIILGNAKFSLGRVPGWLMQQWNKEAPSILLLKNKKY